MASSQDAHDGVAPPPVRRIITGHSASGNSTVIFDDQVHLKPSGDILPGVNGGKIWLSESSPTDNSDQEIDMAQKDVSLRLGLVAAMGSRCGVTELEPGGKVAMHRSHSIDYNVLVSGQLTHILDDGTEQTLTEPGSIVVQRGTLHGWANPSRTEWARWITVILDAKPVSIVDGKTGEWKETTEEFQV